MHEKAILIILDGFGIAPPGDGNAIYLAKTPFIDKLISENPHSQLNASGTDVGLPSGVMGNSEVGHINIGAGRIIYQLNTIIDNAIKDKTFFENKTLLDAITHAKKYNSKIHLMGLLSDGSVHSSLRHLHSLLDFFEMQNYKNIYLHAFTDGRDTLPYSGEKFIKDYITFSDKKGFGKIAGIVGRYYSMDRDNRWDRVEKAYRGLVFSDGEFFENPISAIKSSYEKNISDEFILPKIITKDGKPLAPITDNDVVIFFNFRSDRPRELTRSFIFDNFSEFNTKKFKNLKFITFTPYEDAFADRVDIVFRPQKLTNTLGEVISKKGLSQLRTAETEKYPHVTFFFDGGIEKPFDNEKRIMINSPKVASYDLQPEMSAYEVKDKLVEEIKNSNFDLIVVNFANCDMVGHTGIIEAVIKAIETIDICIKEVVETAIKQNYNIFITADHGNAEALLDENNNRVTSHSKNPVPFIVKLLSDKKIKLKNGNLSDIAPTILKVMNIEIPKEMSGDILIKEI